MEQLRGVVVKKPTAVGSKSERMGIFLETGDATLLLRRAGGNAFADEVLESLVGSEVEMVGTRRGDMLIVSEWTVTKRG